MESEAGHLRFPSQVTRAIAGLKIESYPLLYENEAAVGVIAFLAVLSVEEINAFGAELAACSPEERGEALSELLDALSPCDAAFELPKTLAQGQTALDAFSAMSTEDQAQAIRTTQHLWMGFLAGFFQNLAVMVHGEKLTALVARAKAGDDDAFCKAVQIDKRILTTIPYFKQRFERSSLEQDQNFVDALAYRLRCPPYQGKIRHKALYMVFAFLERTGLLPTLKHREILDICQEVGLDRHASRIDDVKNLSKRLAEYKAFQARGLVMSTP